MHSRLDHFLQKLYTHTPTHILAQIFSFVNMNNRRGCRENRLVWTLLELCFNTTLLYLIKKKKYKKYKTTQLGLPLQQVILPYSKRYCSSAVVYLQMCGWTIFSYQFEGRRQYRFDTVFKWRRFRLKNLWIIIYIIFCVCVCVCRIWR